MTDIISKIPNCIEESGMTRQEFRGVMLAKGVSIQTADKLFDGFTTPSLPTLRVVAEVLDKDIGELIEFA